MMVVQTDRDERTQQRVSVSKVLRIIADRLRRIDEGLSSFRAYNKEVEDLLEKSLVERLKVYKRWRDEMRTRMDTTPISILIELAESKLAEAAERPEGIARLLLLKEVEGILDGIKKIMESRNALEKFAVLRRRGYTDPYR